MANIAVSITTSHIWNQSGKVHMISETDRMGKTLYIGQELGKLLLREHGVVLPFALTLDLSGDNPKTCFPRDELQGAEWQELVDAAAFLIRQIAAGVVGSIALGTTLQSGDESGLGLQVETRQGVLLWVYPYEGEGKERRLAEGSEANGMLVGPLLAGRPTIQ